ncbi:cysteine desulfurase family protein [Paenibacillus sp. HB172176]|uniref:cysteine desulfurase family protein n=1 Tax=Paenibacillus sp. HB172176 TaxID=2493690 RepID=UPI003211E1F6
MYYFDHAATTPLHPEVIHKMLEIMQGPGGNSSSIHAYGRAAKKELSHARDLISGALRCKPGELLFTSGGTESDNAAIIGAARAQRRQGKTQLITSAAEHHAVLHTCGWLQREEGFSLSILPVDHEGRVDSLQLQEALGPQTALVSIMHGNNEVGTLQEIEALGELVHAAGALFHVDAVQTLGKMPIALDELPVDLMSFSAHKINGPQGAGALYISSGTPFEALQQGGSQERKRRGGTENIAGIAGFAAAVDICVNKMNFQQPFLDKLRKRWVELLAQGLGEDAIAVNGHPVRHLPHIANISFLGIDTESMLMNLDMAGIAAASGSACTSGSLEKSHVLGAMGLSQEIIDSAVRFSFGLGNTLEELEEAAGIVVRIARRLRESA